MHVRDGSPKNKKILKRERPVKDLSQKRPRKRDAKMKEKPKQMIKKEVKMGEKHPQTSMRKKG